MKKEIEVLFSTKSSTDAKNITNKLEKKLPLEKLEKIENGITSEDLDQFQKEGIPIFKYQTQITIHGLFPHLGNERIFGYKNLFQNKNKSIGVRWNAIDEEKRQRIAKHIKWAGFQYLRDSQGTEFELIKRVTNENFAQTLMEVKTVDQKINTDLFYGGKNISTFSIYGLRYICLSFSVKAIKEENIEKLCTAIISMDEVKEKQRLEDEKRAEAEMVSQQKRREVEAKKAETMKNKESEIAKIHQLGVRVEKCQDEGKFILVKFNYKDELVFSCRYVYLPKGKKKPRSNEYQYYTADEAIAHQWEEKYSDGIWNGRITGTKLF